MTTAGNDGRPFETPFLGRSPQDAGDRLLFRSPNFTVRSSWEWVFLEGRGLGREVTVGDFYGNPVDAAIDPDEQWCVMVGCGVIAYRLREPWTSYQIDHPSDQWWDFGNEPDDILWLARVEHDSGDRFILIRPGAEPGGDQRYVLECSTRRVFEP